MVGWSPTVGSPWKSAPCSVSIDYPYRSHATYLLESMINNHLTIGVGYSGKQIPDCVISLLVYFLLRVRDRFNVIGIIHPVRHGCLSNNLTSFIDDNFPKMVSDTKYVFLNF